MTSPAPFNVLFVCTGNVCRSAFAEVLCRQLFDDRLGPASLHSFAVSSAGLRAVTGSGMHPDTREVLGLWGPSLFEASEHFVARPLRAHMVRWADLILTAEDEHRDEIAWTAPEAAREAVHVAAVRPHRAHLPTRRAAARTGAQGAHRGDRCGRVDRAGSAHRLGSGSDRAATAGAPACR